MRSGIRTGSSHLIIAADPTQGFQGRDTSWKSLGLDARGRTHLMRRSYRTTREVLNFATLLYRQRLADEKDDDIQVPDLLDMPNGAFPQLVPLASPQDEIVRAANEAADFVRQGLPRKHLLLLHPDGEGVRALVQAIDDRLGKGAARDPKETYPGDYVRVTTLNAGAGLESPIVFLVGLKELFEMEQSLRLSDSEREALVRDHGPQALFGGHPGRTAAGHTLCGGAAGSDPVNPFSIKSLADLIFGSRTLMSLSLLCFQVGGSMIASFGLQIRSTWYNRKQIARVYASINVLEDNHHGSI